MNAEEFADLLIENKIAIRDELKGCSENEIERLEKYIHANLPQSYRKFLALMGHKAGIFHRGSDYSYKDLFHLTKDTREMLADGPFKLPEDAFVISSHQGYIFAYFILSDDDDPPVYTYMETESEPQQWATSFSEYLAKSWEEYRSNLITLESFKRERDQKSGK